MDPINPDLKTPPTISPTPKPSILLLILSISLIISLAGIGILVYQNKQLQKQISTLRSQPTPTPTPLPAETLVKEGDPTANWKTYSNSRYLFKYPQMWETQPIPNGAQQTILLLSPDKFMSLSLSLDLQGLGYECLTKIKEETITIDAQKVTKTTFTGAINDMCGDNTKQRDVWISIPRENKLDHLTFSTDEENFDKAMEIFDQILSTFRFLDTTSPAPTTAPQSTPAQTNGVELKNIRYTLPAGWEATLNIDNLHLAPKSGGGFLSIKVYSYPGTTGRREYYCQLRDVCIPNSHFTEMVLGNISGYLASAIDNSGGGAEYFGAKGNKFYIISSYSPPSPNDFDTNYRSVLSSLIF